MGIYVSYVIAGYSSRFIPLIFKCSQNVVKILYLLLRFSENIIIPIISYSLLLDVCDFLVRVNNEGNNIDLNPVFL